MTFTKTNPARFVDDRKLLAQITDIAQTQCLLNEFNRMFVQHPDEILKAAVALTLPASVVAGEQVFGHERVLSVLFAPDALDLIKSKCRNTYWFWFLLGKLATSTFPVDSLAVARAHARAKDALKDNRYGFAFIDTTCLEHELKGLPPGFVFEMWHSGRLIASRPHSGEYKVILNPLLVDD